MIEIFAHRGSAGTCPENTIASFSEAVRVGADGIELDVHLTKDNEIVVIHDHTVDRTTNGTGRIIDYTLKELQQLDAGSWFLKDFHKEKIPTLREVFSMMKDNKLYVNIELKNVMVDYINLEELVVKEIEKYNFSDRVIISSYNHYALKKIHDLNSDLECAILYMENLFKPWDYASMLGAKSLHPPFQLINNNITHEARKRNVPIRAYTVNHKDDMQRLMKEECVGIITDYPEKALEVRDKMGYI